MELLFGDLIGNLGYECDVSMRRNTERFLSDNPIICINDKTRVYLVI